MAKFGKNHIRDDSHHLLATSQNRKKKPRVADTLREKEGQDKKTHFPTKTEGFRSFLDVVFESHPCMTKLMVPRAVFFPFFTDNSNVSKRICQMGGWMDGWQLAKVE